VDVGEIIHQMSVVHEAMPRGDVADPMHTSGHLEQGAGESVAAEDIHEGIAGLVDGCPG